MLVSHTTSKLKAHIIRLDVSLALIHTELRCIFVSKFQIDLVFASPSIFRWISSVFTHGWGDMMLIDWLLWRFCIAERVGAQVDNAVLILFCNPSQW